MISIKPTRTLVRTSLLGKSLEALSCDDGESKFVEPGPERRYLGFFSRCIMFCQHANIDQSPAVLYEAVRAIPAELHILFVA